jgi:hypothetical protein
LAGTASLSGTFYPAVPVAKIASFLTLGTTSSTAPQLAARLQSVSQAFDGAAAKFQTPPDVPDEARHNALLRNPHQTFNGVARMLKDQAHHVQLATADVYIGDDAPAQRLQQQLQDWWKQMHKLAAKYQQLQGTFSNMLHGQTAVLKKMQDLVTTLLSNVELAQQLASCRSRDIGQEEICRNNTAGLLQDCRDAITKARAKIIVFGEDAQAVQEQHEHLVSGLADAQESMEGVSTTAAQQHSVATREVQDAQYSLASAQRSADVSSAALMPAGLMALAMCTISPPACLFGLYAAGSVATRDTAVQGELSSAEQVLLRSANLQQALRGVHAESQRAAEATAHIHSVVVQQSVWVKSIVSGLAEIESVMSDVIDITLRASMRERNVVLKQLHMELSKLLEALIQLSEKSSSQQVVQAW